MDPIIPEGSLTCSRTSTLCPIMSSEDTTSSNMIIESPYWPMRTWHIHTQHPLEFTEVLNGFDIPMFHSKAYHHTNNDLNNNKDCLSSDDNNNNNTSTSSTSTGQYCESWESMFATLDGLFEW